MKKQISTKKNNRLKLDFKIEDPYKFTLRAALLIITYTLLRNLWISDDAFITMRVVDNFVNGFGLVWNAGERVQVYTNPLWMFLLSIVYFFSKNAYTTFYLLSFSASIATASLILYKFANNYPKIIIGALLLLASAAFMDYSSSGLENPLTHLLLAQFAYVVLKQPFTPTKNLLAISILASLATVNRLDAILFYIPALIYFAYQSRLNKLNTWLTLAVGFLPLIAWLAFALFYYGFWAPNTYYAKLSSGIPTHWFYTQGWNYLRNSIRWDPITLTLSAVTAFLILSERKPVKLILLCGSGIYLLYVVSIGGDFMSGRFLSGIYVISVILALVSDYQPLFGSFDIYKFRFLILTILALAITAEMPPLSYQRSWKAHITDQFGIANEKSYYFPQTGITNYLSSLVPPVPVQGQHALTDRNAGMIWTYTGNIGVYGYYAGHSIYVLDKMALSDPLRSKLPAIERPMRIGHFEQYLPEGYKATTQDHFINKITDPNLHLYYDKLSILIYDDLYTPGRLQEILNFNLGKYNYLLVKYQQDHP